MKKSEYAITATIILVQVLIAMGGFLILMGVFEFPDILREPAEYRFNLFLEGQHIIVPVYYLLALTGLLQVVISVLFYRILKRESAVVMLGAVFGILCGIFQVEGFIRWPILIPYLAEAQGISGDAIAFVEGAFNHYAGMAIGEHLGFLMQAAWTVCLGVAIIQGKLFTKALGWVGIVIGLLSVPMSLEPLGGPLATFGELTNPVLSAWYIWLVFLAISLFRTSPSRQEAPRFSYLSSGMGIAAWLICVVPAYL